MSEDLRGLILQTFDSNRIKAVAVQEKMMTLRQDGIQKVLEGTTTLEEVLRVTQG
jgi:general secretion pathway protein E